ncbi:MAG: glutaredoxin family protein [Methanomicrobiales archaeon]|nr:glutaredoxin family protein [Methanomicrobiales archaeon]
MVIVQVVGVRMPGTSQKKLSPRGPAKPPFRPLQPAEGADLVVYSLEDCSQCEALKSYLRRQGFSFTEEDMGSAASLTELRMCGIFTMEAPVLRKGEKFLTTDDLFAAGKLREDAVWAMQEGGSR